MQSCAIKSWGRVLLAQSVNPCRHLSARSGAVWKLQSRRVGARAASLTTAASSSRRIERILPRHDDFSERHIGPGEREKREMLDVLELEVRFILLNTTKHVLFVLFSVKTLLLLAVRRAADRKHSSILHPDPAEFEDG